MGGPSSVASERKPGSETGEHAACWQNCDSDVLENRLVMCRARTARGEQSGLLALSDGISPSSPSCSLASVHAGLHAVSPTLLRAFALAPPTAWPGLRWTCLRLTTLPASSLCSNVLFSVRVILTT